jgi:hypothetical protein
MGEIPGTILMPVHDAERCLPRALDSVFRQTWQDFELLAVTAASSSRRHCVVASAAGERSARPGRRA